MTQTSDGTMEWNVAPRSGLVVAGRVGRWYIKMVNEYIVKLVDLIEELRATGRLSFLTMRLPGHHILFGNHLFISIHIVHIYCICFTFHKCSCTEEPLHCLLPSMLMSLSSITL